MIISRDLDRIRFSLTNSITPIIPAATTLVVALIGLGSAIYQTEKPIQLTEVAQTAAAITQTAAAPTLFAQSTQSSFAPTYLAQTIQAGFQSTLAALTAQAPTQTASPVQPTGTQAPAATASAASPTVSISNTTNKDCDMTINKGWDSEFVTGAVVGANQDTVGFGYYKLFTNSNVTLDCKGKIYWWGTQPDEKNPTSFFDQVEKDTGIIYFTLK
jgi:hypothetical protein